MQNNRADPETQLVHRLSYVRWERGWSYQDLVDVIARRINTASRREKAWRWEHWGVVPDRETQLALAAELDVSPEIVRTAGWPDWLPCGEQIDTRVPWTVEGGLTLLTNIAGGAVLDRRGFLILGAGAVTTLANDWLSIDPPAVASALRGGRIDGSLVASFEQRLPMLRGIYDALGGGRARNIADAELRLVTEVLSTSSYSEVVGRRLFFVAAELGRIAGFASLDAGLHAAAERYWVAALRAAHIARERSVGANILKSMILQRLETDRVDEALSLSRAAVAGARQAPARVVAMLTVRQARAHAARGEASNCERLLATAERAMTRAGDEDTPPWAAYFDNAEYCAQVASCYLLLHRYADSHYWLNQNLALQPDDRVLDRATYVIWQADSVLHLGDIEQACYLVGEAIPDLAAARSVRNQRRLSDLYGRLSKNKKMPVVMELRERLRPLMAIA